jgi:hypothetical protein
MSDKLVLERQFLYYQKQIEDYLKAASSSSVPSASGSSSSASGSSPSCSGGSSDLASLLADPPPSVAAVLVGEAHDPVDNQEVAEASHVVSLAAPATTAAVVCAVEDASLTAASSSFSTLLPVPVLRPGRPASAPPPSSAVASSWLDSSLAENVLRRYHRNWDDWCSFAASHRVSALPPDETALEFYISNLAESSMSVSSVDMAKASIAHFCARGRFQSPFDSPYFRLIIRGIRN